MASQKVLLVLYQCVKRFFEYLLMYLYRNTSADPEDEIVIPEHFKCPVCFDVPENAIYQCTNGHIICHLCISKISQCPQCRVSFHVNGKAIRNRALETHMESVPAKCPYKEQGCLKKVLKVNMKSHTQECEFNPKNIWICKLLGYKCDIFLNDQNHKATIEHMWKAHCIFVDQLGQGNKVIRLEMTKFTYQIFKMSSINDKPLFKGGVYKVCMEAFWEPKIMCVNGYYMLLVTRLHRISNTISWTCYSLRDKCSLTTKFKIQCPRNRLHNLQWETPVLPIIGFLGKWTNPMQLSVSTLQEHYAENGSLNVIAVIKTPNDNSSPDCQLPSSQEECRPLHLQKKVIYEILAYILPNPSLRELIVVAVSFVCFVALALSIIAVDTANVAGNDKNS